MKRPTNQRGFTLIEMMIALLVSGIVVAPFYLITRGVSEETTNQQMGTEAIQRARIGLHMLMSDFQRAGMMTSPNPSVDRDSMVSQTVVDATNTNNQCAFYRPAVIHLNRDGADPFDSVLLVGNFLSSGTYAAHVLPDQVVIDDPFDTEEEALEEFSSNYAYAHLYSTTGQTLDAKISDVTCMDHPIVATKQQCTLTLVTGELFLSGPGAFAEGQQIRVAANQAALYRVEPVSGRNVLMRYFVDFDGTSSLGTGCDLSDIESSIQANSGKVIADYIEEFQVWFRTAYRNDATLETEPQKTVYHDLSTLSTLKGPFVPGSTNAVFGMSEPSASVSTVNLSCDPTIGMLSAQHVRSAMVQLGIRTEETDMSMKITAADMSGGIVKYNVASAPENDVGVYKVRTLFSETTLPNIMARMSSFNNAGDVPDSFE